MFKRISAAALFLVTSSTWGMVRGGEISYLEQFSLASDRSAALQQLVPGTEDYYYYHCLHLQQQQQFDEVPALLQKWVERHGETMLVREIRHRQALLTYPANHRATLDYLQRELGLRYDHQREAVDRAAEWPTALPADQITRETLLNSALQQQDLSGLEDRALTWFARTELNDTQRRLLLQRLNWPDLPNLAAMVVADLNAEHSGGFGSLPIHRQLLLAQLDECLRLKPELLNETNFVQTYLTKLRPSDDVNWQHRPDEELRYLERLWSFVSRLSDVHNSLKAHVLYHRLAYDWKHGDYDKQRFMTYLRLPRPVVYMLPKYLERPENRHALANLAEDFSGVTGHAAVHQDESLVRSYLQYFLKDAPNYREYAGLIEENYLKQLFAETKIVHGLGNAEQWVSLLPPAQYQALKARVDLDFVPTNATYISSDDPISLGLFVKNVPTLIVKVYRINASNFYRDQNQPVNTAINLDGLVPNEEKTYQYTEPPLLRVKRNFEFPSLKDPGVYVIDFIGNGRSSRVLVHKGQLHYLMRVGAAGQMLTVLNEQNEPVKNAAVWMGGREYQAEENGEIRIPYSTQPGRQSLVLTDGSLVTFDTLEHLAETYELRAGIYVSRETLLSRRIAPIVIRPGLALQGVPISISALEEPRLEIVSTDLDGVSSTSEVTDLKLEDGEDYTHLLRVPPRLQSLAITLRGQVMVGSENKKVDVAASESYVVNAIDQSSLISQVLMTRENGSHLLQLTGKTGERLAGRAVHVTLKHRDFTQPVHASLRSDEQGRVQLGALPGIESISAQLDGHPQPRVWQLDTAQATFVQQVHARVGKTIEVPYAIDGGSTDLLNRTDLALLERRADTYVADRFEAIKMNGGLLTLEDLSAGDYDLVFKREGRVIRIRVVAGESTAGYAIGASRKLQLSGQSPLAIDRLDVQKEAVEIQLRHFSPATRVHVFAMHFAPKVAPFEYFAHVTRGEPIVHPRSPLPTFYMQGRTLGDEYRYVLERKYARKFPGNMLPRPEVLLNPWEVQETETEQERLEAGQEFAPAAPAMDAAAGLMKKSDEARHYDGDFETLDFLPVGSYVALNLEPDEAGRVTIPREELRGERLFYVVAVDPVSTVQRMIVLPEGKYTALDLRLAKGLDAATHFALQKQISVQASEATFEIANLGSGRYQMYDSLARVYQLYETLLPGSKLGDFRFLTRWHEMKPEEKAELYKQHASHELHFFLYRKDRPYFDAVVKPYLANKLHKTFLDHYLLEMDLRSYYEPWKYAQLNVVERILLSQRVAEERERVANELAQILDLMPADLDRWNHLFDTALLGEAMDAYAEDRKLAERGESLSLVESAPFGGGARGAEPPAAAAPEVERMMRGRRMGRAFNAPGTPSDAAKENWDEMASKRARGEGEGGMGGMGKDVTDGPAANFGYMFSDADLRQQTLGANRFYQMLDATKEWAESNYYRVPIQEQNAELVALNPFWADWAKYRGDGPFLSQHFLHAARNTTEAVLALALLDLPPASPEHKIEVVEQAIRVRAAGPVILLHEELEKAAASEDKVSKILVSQNYFRADDRQQVVGGITVDKFVTDEFLTHVVYGGRVVVTNPTSTNQQLNVLIQIPEGALPVQTTKVTDTHSVQLGPYTTQSIEYFFYFPETGDFPQYPANVTQTTRLVAAAEATSFHVVATPSRVDEKSWDYVSQYSENEQVLDYLRQQNIHGLALGRIAFRMSDVEMYRQTLEILRRRHVYDHTLWSYSIRHDDPDAIREFLGHHDALIQQAGYYLDSPLLAIDPVARKTYEHLEYRPLVNARAHQIGERRQILNDRFHAQYERWLKLLSYHAQLSAEQQMATVYYLLLQDRISEAVDRMERIEPDQLATRLQYDYCQAYLSMSQGKTDDARAIAMRYANYPVERWQEMFALVKNHLDEMEGKSSSPLDPRDRNQSQDQLAANQPTLDLAVSARNVSIRYRNLTQARVRFYLMDIELLFSHNPFVQQHQGQFSYIAPNVEQTVELPAGQAEMQLPLPNELQNQNVLVEVEGAGIRQARPFYSNDLSVQMMENYGQLQVTDSQSHQPLSTVYCKVYARQADGQTVFYKDGYTDLRGRFDYSSLSTGQLNQVERFAILILSESKGAEVREVAPPKR